MLTIPSSPTRSPHIHQIHLLHNERGPFLENINTRTICPIEQTNEDVHLAQDVATFFNFGALQQQFIGFKLEFDLSAASLRRFVAVPNHLGYWTLMERSFSYGSPPTLQ